MVCPPIRLGKPGLVRPWVWSRRSQRVRRVVPCHMISGDIERAGAGSTAAGNRKCRKEDQLGRHDPWGSCCLGNRRRGGGETANTEPVPSVLPTIVYSVHQLGCLGVVMRKDCQLQAFCYCRVNFDAQLPSDVQRIRWPSSTRPTRCPRESLAPCWMEWYPPHDTIVSEFTDRSTCVSANHGIQVYMGRKRVRWPGATTRIHRSAMASRQG